MRRELYPGVAGPPSGAERRATSAELYVPDVDEVRALPAEQQMVDSAPGSDFAESVAGDRATAYRAVREIQWRNPVATAEACAVAAPCYQDFRDAGGGTRTPDTRIMIPLL